MTTTATITTHYTLVSIGGTELFTGCAECNGEGRTPNGSCTGDTAGGWADTCDVCHGTGKDLRGCEWCSITHAPQDCPAIRAELMKG